MSTRGIRATLMEYFAKRTGEYVYANDLMKATSLSLDQIQGNINNLIRDDKLGKLNFPIEVITRGQIWVHRPAPAKVEPVQHERRVFEELGWTKRGTLIIQDEKGTLFEATEL